MAAAIDPSLLPDHSPWSHRAYVILDEMSSRGNIIAEKVLSELKQLDTQLQQLLSQDAGSGQRTMHPAQNLEIQAPSSYYTVDTSINPSATFTHPVENDSSEDFALTYELSPEQLMGIANSLNIESLTWSSLDSEA